MSALKQSTELKLDLQKQDSLCFLSKIVRTDIDNNTIDFIKLCVILLVLQHLIPRHDQKHEFVTSGHIPKKHTHSDICLWESENKPHVHDVCIYNFKPYSAESMSMIYRT